MNTEEQQQDGLKTTEEQPPAVSLHLQEESAHTESTHLEEEKQSEMNTHTPDSTPPAPECQGNISQEQQESRGTCVVEEAATRLGVHPLN